MNRSCLVSLILVLVLSVAAACGDSAAEPDAQPIVLFDSAPPIDAPIPDATPPIDAQLFPLNEAVGLDTATIVGGPAFTALSGFIDLQGQIDSGGMLLALEWRGLDDPSGQNDDNMAIGFYQCDDPDMNTDNNYDVDNPDRWVATADSVDASGDPTVLFDVASATGGLLDATSSTGTITLPAAVLPIPIVLHEPRLQGLLVPSGDAKVINYLADEPEGVAGELSGTMTISTLAAASNPGMGLCPGSTLLDVIVAGCTVPGLITLDGIQPDFDRDDDGLEVLCDTCDDEACAGYLSQGALDAGSFSGGTVDGRIECCVDNTAGVPVVTTGVSCWNDAAFADGYAMNLEIHGTRILLLSEVDPG